VTVLAFCRPIKPLRSVFLSLDVAVDVALPKCDRQDCSIAFVSVAQIA
jgi:hypothetical protein